MTTQHDFSTYTKRLRFLLNGGKLTTKEQSEPGYIYWDEDVDTINSNGMETYVIRDNTKEWRVYHEPRTFDLWLIVHEETGDVYGSFREKELAEEFRRNSFNERNTHLKVVKTPYTVF